MSKRVTLILSLLLIAGISIALAMKAGTGKPPAPLPVIDTTTRRIADTWNSHAVDSAIGYLHTGDIVLRMGFGADSYLLARLNHRDKRFSHCGIVVVEEGKPWVYHSIGGEDNPDERLRRDPAASFFSPAHNSSIAIVRYHLRAGETKELTRIAHSRYAARPRFDMQFDLSTDDKLYCSEFVYKSVCSAVHDTTYLPTTQGVARRYVGIDDLFLNAHAAMVFQIKFKQYL
ncbi:MAG: YiiX/YebB-like N1pC/P60 family cysteine hydrolase [Bacteroidota bacterium]